MSTAVLPHLPEDASELTRWRVGMQLLLFLKDHPDNPTAGAMLHEALDMDAFARAAERMARDPQARRILDDRPSLSAADLDLAPLRALPEGTLGRTLADYYDEHQIAPFHTEQSTTTHTEYLTKRFRETHDIVHVVTGYGTDVVGEMELQAFVMGNLGFRSPRLMLPLGFLGGRLSDDFIGASTQPVRTGIVAYYQRVWRAYQRGKQATPLLDVRYEDHWATPVRDLRAQYIDRPAAQ